VATRIRTPLGAQEVTTTRGPVEQLGCARRPVKAEVAGSNPVGTARTGAVLLLSPGQVAQSVERAAENRKVGGSIPSLPTRFTQVSGAMR
jgi:hypothetical protein